MRDKVYVKSPWREKAWKESQSDRRRGRQKKLGRLIRLRPYNSALWAVLRILVIILRPQEKWIINWAK